MNAKYNEQKHQELLAVGRKLEKGIAHKLDEPFVDSLLGTLEFFNASDAEMKQFIFDLKVAKYKIWDFLGMNYDSHYMQEQPVFVGIEKLVDLYIKMEDVGGFAWFLRGHDLQIEEPKKCDHCIESYNDYKSKSPEQLAKEQQEMLDFYGGNIIEV
jgi:hypothetical protein